MDETSPQGRASIAAIARALKRVLRSGIHLAELGEHEYLLGLRCVSERMGGSTDPDVLALGLESVLHEAIEALPAGPGREAVRRLFGVVPVTHWEQLTVRRRMAADALRVGESAFRNQHERKLLRYVAAEIFRIEIGASRPMG